VYGFTATLTGLRFDQALTRPMEALKVDRFGVPNNLDVQGAMKCKLCARLVDNGAPVRVF
jgi:hypothetical protein